MTTRAVDLARITGKHEDPYYRHGISEICWVPWCLFNVAHKHHVMSRSALAGAYDWLDVSSEGGAFRIGNVVGLCFGHHQDIHDGRASLGLVGRAWEFEGDGRRGLLNPPAPVRTLTGEDTVADPGVATAARLETEPPPVSVPPGQDCPECKRRVPYPRKKTSPKSKTFGFRVPLDEVDEFAKLLDAAAEHWGVKPVPHHRYRLILDALVLVLQTESKEAA